jgi:hypothetical protein
MPTLCGPPASLAPEARIHGRDGHETERTDQAGVAERGAQITNSCTLSPAVVLQGGQARFGGYNTEAP